MKQLWETLSGYKTIIGVALYVAGMVIKDVVVGYWDVHGPWVEPTIQTLNYFAALIGGTGVVHKMFKEKTASKTEQPAP